MVLAALGVVFLLTSSSKFSTSLAKSLCLFYFMFAWIVVIITTVIEFLNCYYCLQTHIQPLLGDSLGSIACVFQLVSEHNNSVRINFLNEILDPCCQWKNLSLLVLLLTLIYVIILIGMCA